jgi:hypothetical protein
MLPLQHAAVQVILVPLISTIEMYGKPFHLEAVTKN